ncbi:shikimate dehydrogenase [Nocardioides mesophilus]|uniref:Shikimate dehydrogenase n=1 Tax=Nocardioides mesophilus TaxID=433659 RepID=A0A7G9RAA6_9ACTN|nr:shikimate dehydrogenase [Nocardioides mesophilus]QNN52531.1 shikimate dehydrogenase [Nocardioides mesophilus]
MTTHCAVLGSPIAHSLSPVLHRAAYAELGLDWEYDACEVREADLPGFLDGLDSSWRGLSLTMPLKRAVVPLLDELSARAGQAGAANTVVLRGGRRVGHNTDVPGVAAALRERYDGPLRSAVVLGGGATAASVLLALGDLGCPRADLVVRDPGRAGETLAAVARHPTPPRVEVRTFAELAAAPTAMSDLFDEVDLVASTVPVTAQTPTVLAACAAATVVFEVLYDPWPTPLALAARERDQMLVGGLDLLVHQAVLQVQLMTGSLPSLDVLRAAGERALLDR